MIIFEAKVYFFHHIKKNVFLHATYIM